MNKRNGMYFAASRETEQVKNGEFIDKEKNSALFVVKMFNISQ